MGVFRAVFRRLVEGGKARRRLARMSTTWDVTAAAMAVRADVVELERSGLLDPGLLSAYEAELVALVEREVSVAFSGVRDVLGVELAEAVFGECLYTNRLDRQLATGAAASAEAFVEEALSDVAAAVALRMCQGPPPRTVAWPRASVVPRADARSSS